MRSDCKKTFYLLGKSIKNSLSPFIHNKIYCKMGFRAQYLLKETAVLPQLRQIDADGFNITAPFKAQVLKQLNQNFSPYKGVNTVKKIKTLGKDFIGGDFIGGDFRDFMGGDFMDGYSTDGQGFLLDAQRLNLDLSSVLILGTGGAAGAVACALSQSNLYVWGRNKLAEKALATQFNATIFDKNAGQKIKLIVNCTGTDLPLFSGLNAPVYDLNYVTPHGISGIGMLIYQAILADEIFFDTKIDLTIFNPILSRLKKSGLIAN